MFERFTSVFRLDPGETQTPWRDEALLQIRGYEECMRQFAGRSFDGGMYRVHSEASGPLGQDLAAAAFPNHAARVRVFGFDWLGRQFAVDSGRVEDGEPLVLMLEPGTGEALEVPAGFEAFHEEAIIDDLRDAVLACGFFEQWRTSSGVTALGFDQCAGYGLPLFLGGSDTVDNLEVSDFEVYWDFCGQLRGQTRRLQPQTQIRSVTPDD